MLDLIRSIVHAQPDAYSRITRTPIFKSNLPSGIEASYLPKFLGLGGSIQVPRGDTIDESALRHESAHSIYDDANLSKIAEQLVPKLSRTVSDSIRATPYYQDKGLSNDLMANEGLGHSVEQSEGSGYTSAVASQIPNLALRQALLRLQKK